MSRHHELSPRSEAAKVAGEACAAMIAIGCPRWLALGHLGIFLTSVRKGPTEVMVVADIMLREMRASMRETVDSKGMMSANDRAFARYVLVLRNLLLWVAQRETS